MWNTTLADVFLSDAFCLLHGKRRGTVRAEMAEEDQPLDTRVPGGLGEGARPFDVGDDEIAAPSLRCRAGEMGDLIHAAQRGPDTALIAQTDDRHLHRDSFWDARRSR